MTSGFIIREYFKLDVTKNSHRVHLGIEEGSVAGDTCAHASNLTTQRTRDFERDPKYIVP